MRAEQLAKQFIDDFRNERNYRSQYFGAHYIPCDKYIAFSSAAFSDNYYLTGECDGIDLVALGNWSGVMFPPSLLEAIVGFCILSAIRSRVNIGAHLNSFGCIFDFNEFIDKTRYGIITGFICKDCKNVISDTDPQLLVDLERILGGKWLGDPRRPNSIHSSLVRFGFEPFQTSGVKENWFDRIYKIVSNKFFEETVKYIVLGIVLYLALRLGLGELSSAIK